MLISDYGGTTFFPRRSSRTTSGRRRRSRFHRHHAEWIKACKTGSPTTCNFDYSGALTEAALLCNVALRTGKKLQWDAANLRPQLPGGRPVDPSGLPPGWTL